jgi:glutamate dehydrogenase (NAD(P)+)
VRIDPRALSHTELQRVTRRYTAEIIEVIGPDRDIPAPDLGTNELVMAWIMDTYSQQKGHAVPGVVTGKPIEIGGSYGRKEATGRGVVTCALEASRLLGFDYKGASVAVQGFGEVGGAAARISAGLGARVVAVSDVTSGIYDPKGLDLAAVDAWVKENKFLKSFPGADHVTPQELLELPCDVLIPAAVQNQVGAHNAARLRCRLMVEGANGPTDLEADAILADRHITVVPDIVANAGGVTVSYFEWLQGSQQFFWSEQEVNNRLIQLMQRAFREVQGVAERRKVSLRTAALMRGIERITEAKRVRGVFP